MAQENHPSSWNRFLQVKHVTCNGHTFSHFLGKTFQYFFPCSHNHPLCWIFSDSTQQFLVNWPSGNSCLVDGMPQESFFSQPSSVKLRPRCFFSKGAHWELDWLSWPLQCPLFHIRSPGRLNNPPGHHPMGEIDLLPGTACSRKRLYSSSHPKLEMMWFCFILMGLATCILHFFQLQWSNFLWTKGWESFQHILLFNSANKTHFIFVKQFGIFIPTPRL